MRRRFLALCTSLVMTIGVYAQFLSVSDLLKLRTAFKNKQETQVEAAIKATIVQKGYGDVYQPSDDKLYFYKNCKLVVVNGGLARDNYIDAEPKNSYSSMGYISISKYGGYISVSVYSKANAQKWFNQLKVLGYKDNGDSGEGNKGQSWEYSKIGYPDICIWNDYGNTYSLSVSF